MNTTTLNLNQLAKHPKTIAEKPAAPKKKPVKREPAHWTVKLFKHIDALGDELRKEGKTL